MIKSPRKRTHTSKLVGDHSAAANVRNLDDDDGNQSQQAQNRAVGSLVILTQKFVKLMKDNNGEIDLGEATMLLDVQKRRIYDITNVLEGVGLIEKTKHSSVRWKGNFSGVDEEPVLSAALLRKADLQDIEADLDMQLDYARRNLKYMKRDAQNSSYAYVTRDDLLKAYGDDVVFAIPKNEDEVILRPDENTIHFFLDNGSTIDVRLVTQQGECTMVKKEEELSHNRLSPKTENKTPSKMAMLRNHRQQRRTITRTASSSSSSIDERTTTDLVTDDHKYSCDPDMKEEIEELERALTAKVMFQNCTANHSLRRFYPDDPNLDNSPLLQLNPPQNEYPFALAADEGLCELFDLPCS